MVIKRPERKSSFKAIEKINANLEITLTTYINIDVFIDESETIIKLHDQNVDLTSFDFSLF
ncbi:MAG: hypothetical protein WDN66_00380 [Candidatus Saccharibacteria bacterium]